ncbi:MAG: hypothetical protein IJU79_02480 [Desulfovibrionaceae bacterium]|nr:hypothetical protein [Desulfovibrionaceae bacterium]
MEKEQQTQSTVSQEQSQSESVDQQSYSYSHKLLNILLGAFVAAVVIVAALLCQARVQVMERDFLLEQQKLGQSWVENALESLGRWREKAIETINYVSQAEMFRLFIHDCEEACGSKIDLLQSQEVRLDEAIPYILLVNN